MSHILSQGDLEPQQIPLEGCGKRKTINVHHKNQGTGAMLALRTGSRKAKIMIQ